MSPVMPVDNSLVGIGAVAVAIAGATLLAHGAFVPGSSLFGPVISRAPRRRTSSVALTFDDGPFPGQTEAILDTLAHHRVSAAFFVIGRYAEEHPGLIERIHAEGHLIGNHTFDHARLGMFRGLTYWIDQIRRTSEVVREIIGQPTGFFRPPMGFKSPIVMQAARECGTPVVTWSRRAFDGVPTTPDAVVDRVSRARSGEILLLHDGRDPASERPLGATAAALPELISRLQARGLAIAALDALLEVPPVQDVPVN